MAQLSGGKPVTEDAQFALPSDEAGWRAHSGRRPSPEGMPASARKTGRRQSEMKRTFLM
jgi:hypothetical protein